MVVAYGTPGRIVRYVVEKLRREGVKLGFFRSESDLAYHDEIVGDLFAQVQQTQDLLFTKYLSDRTVSDRSVSDECADSGDFVPLVVIPRGASFEDMVALKGKLGIGDKINTQIGLHAQPCRAQRHFWATAAKIWRAISPPKVSAARARSTRHAK